MNCKPGDLAYIVACPNSPENVGRIVEVIRLATETEYDTFHGIAPTWIVKSRSPIRTTWRNGHSRYVTLRPICDKYLRPISGVPVHDEEHNEVTA